MVTAGAVPSSWTLIRPAAGPAPNETYCSGWSGPDRAGSLVAVREELARLHRHVCPVRDQRAGVLYDIRRLQ